MKILLDECVPKRLRSLLSAHDLVTVPEAGWASLKNGELLSHAGGKFDDFITVDSNLAFQQNLQRLPIPVVVLHAQSNKLKDLQVCAPALLQLLSEPLAKEVFHVRA